MPFGKFKNKPLTDIDTQYLFWLLGLSNLKIYLKMAVESELTSRGYGAAFEKKEEKKEEKPPPRPYSYQSLLVKTPPTGVDRGLLLRLVAEGRRGMAREYHPDIGGSNEQMQMVNAGADWLVEVLEGL